MGFEFDGWLFGSRAACLAALALAALAWAAGSRRALRAAAIAAFAAALAGAGALAELGRLQAAVPLRQPPDSGFAAAAALLAVVGVAAWRADRDGARPRAALLALAAGFAAFAGAAFAEGHSQVLERVPTLRSAWLPVHAGAWSLTVALTLAAAFARWTARAGDARTARFAEHCAGAAFAAATLGLASGSLWSLLAWSVLWIWEAKGVLALLAWIALAAAVLPSEALRDGSRARGALIGVAATVQLVSLFGMRFVPTADFTLHYAPPDWAARSEARSPDGSQPALPEHAIQLMREGDPTAFSVSVR